MGRSDFGLEIPARPTVVPTHFGTLARRASSCRWAPVQDSAMRIGTWNLNATWTPAHERVLSESDCDVWLVTEAHVGISLDGNVTHLSADRMDRGQHWAGVLSRRPQEVLPDPHPASAAVAVGGVVFCSSVLPWRSCGNGAPWQGISQR
jgi:hypothetical protein